MQIDANPANPVEYLGCLGVFAIASRLDPQIEGRWPEEGGFELRSTLSEAEIAELIRPVLVDATRWTFDVTDKMASYVIVDFGPFKMRLDWWYDYVNEVTDGRIFEKSSWKFFAGQQSVFATTKDLIQTSAKTLPTAPSLTDLVCYREKITGRFGFDPLASKSALDAGYSADSLGEAVTTSVVAELLGLFAIQVFFPPRWGALARGWIEVEEEKLGFVYCLWEEFLPLTLARVASIRNREEQLFSEKKNRKHYGNLSPAKMI
jgi:hypothetical protein